MIDFFVFTEEACQNIQPPQERVAAVGGINEGHWERKARKLAARLRTSCLDLVGCSLAIIRVYFLKSPPPTAPPLCLSLSHKCKHGAHPHQSGLSKGQKNNILPINPRSMKDSRKSQLVPFTFTCLQQAVSAHCRDVKTHQDTVKLDKMFLCGRIETSP